VGARFPRSKERGNLEERGNLKQMKAKG